MPQERVAELANMSPELLLRATEKAAGGQKLHDLHTRLIELKREEVTAAKVRLASIASRLTPPGRQRVAEEPHKPRGRAVGASARDGQVHRAPHHREDGACWPSRQANAISSPCSISTCRGPAIASPRSITKTSRRSRPTSRASSRALRRPIGRIRRWSSACFWPRSA